MCFGLEAAWLPLLISGGLSAAGGLIDNNESTANAEAIAAARNKVLTGAIDRNTVLSNDARGTFNERLGQVQPAAVAGQQADVTGDRAAVINGNLPTITPGTFPGAAESSSLVKSAMASALDDAVAKANERATAQAKLGGYGDLFMQQGLQDADAGRNIGTDVNFAKANTELIPSLQDFAQQDAYKPNSGIGGILQGLGSAFGSFAGSH